MLARTDAIPIGRPSFLGAARAAIVDRGDPRDASDLRDIDVAVVGSPYTTPADLAASRAPSSAAPEAVRQQSLRFAGCEDGYDFDFGGELYAGRRVRIADCGDVQALPGRYDDNDRAATAVVRAILDTGALPVVLGGDHAAAIPALRACAGRGPLAVVHLGAGLDWRDQVNGVRSSAASAMRRAAELDGVAAMIQIGLRGGGGRAGEVDDARAFGSILVRAEDVHEAGVRAVLARVPAASRYYLSLDAGALDPAIAPGVDTPAFGGLSYYEATNLLKGIAARAPVIGASLTGIVPAHDAGGLTSLLGARLILNLLGALAHAGRLGAVSDTRRIAASSVGPDPQRTGVRLRSGPPCVLALLGSRSRRAWERESDGFVQNLAGQGSDVWIPGTPRRSE
jgi:agmatinase